MSAIYQKNHRRTIDSAVLSAVIWEGTDSRRTAQSALTMSRGEWEVELKELPCLTHTDYFFSRKEKLLTGKPNPNVEI